MSDEGTYLYLQNSTVGRISTVRDGNLTDVMNSNILSVLRTAPPPRRPIKSRDPHRALQIIVHYYRTLEKTLQVSQLNRNIDVVNTHN
jgi:hypothetical protein